MDKLEKDVIDSMNQVNQDWVIEVGAKAKLGKMPSSVEMMGKYSENIKTVMQAFREAKERLKKGGRKGFLG